jgi:hypothetical protein
MQKLKIFMSKIEDIYNTGIGNIIAIYVNLYKKDNDAGLRFAAGEFSVARVLLNEMYEGFVRERILTPIEELPESEKRELWNRCREFKDPMRVCKMLHVLKFI